VEATDERIQAAMSLIDEQRGGGRTELSRALQTGLALPHDDNIARTMVVVTDGYIAAEKEVFKLIADQAGQCNVFTFGIGSSVNRHLVEGLARAGQGEPFVITDPREAADGAARFRKYIEAPVLTGIHVDFEDFGAYDVEPEHHADLFASRPLVICGKWRGALQWAVRVTGTTGNGPYSAQFDIASDKKPHDTPALPYLWAKKRLEHISGFNTGEDDETTRREVTGLGLRYDMLTAYTSFVAVHDVVRNTAEPARDVDQPLPLPRHVSNLAVGTHNVPEPEIAAILLLMMAAVTVPAIRCRMRSGR
jgi:Ca-activated chloride channel homolog